MGMACESTCPQRPEDNVGCHGDKVIGSCEPPALGVGNHQILLTSMPFFQPSPWKVLMGNSQTDFNACHLAFPSITFNIYFVQIGQLTQTLYMLGASHSEG